MNVYLVATNHANQLVGYKNGAAAEFQGYLERLCVEEHIDLIAEELNEEAIAYWGATDSVARLIANQYRLNHIFCEPTADEKMGLGITSDKQLRQKFPKVLTHAEKSRMDQEERSQFPAREAFWLDRILTGRPRNCLFVLGPNHLESFCRLLCSRGIHVEVKNNRWQAHEPPSA